MNMQSLWKAILGHVRVPISMQARSIQEDPNTKYRLMQLLRSCSTTSSINQDEVIDRVVSLVKKFDKIDAATVTETADFEKDLSLDSLDRVELVMAFEGEFSIEIPDAEADKLKCCADVAKYIAGVSSKVSETS